MDTYGQELGFSLAQVSMRAGHDPAVAAKHYPGGIAQTDKDLAEAISRLVEQESSSDLTEDVFGILAGLFGVCGDIRSDRFEPLSERRGAAGDLVVPLDC